MLDINKSISNCNWNSYVKNFNYSIHMNVIWHIVCYILSNTSGALANNKLYKKPKSTSQYQKKSIKKADQKNINKSSHNKTIK